MSKVAINQVGASTSAAAGGVFNKLSHKGQTGKHDAFWNGVYGALRGAAEAAQREAEKSQARFETGCDKAKADMREGLSDLRESLGIGGN